MSSSKIKIMSVEGTTAPILTLQQYLSGSIPRGPESDNSLVNPKDRLLVVPQWQREYVWAPSETGEVGILLQDLKDFLDGEETDYLMGSILLSQGGKEPHQRLIIDGQQRSLTFTILLMAVLKHITNASLHETNDPHQDRTRVDMRSCISKSDHSYDPLISMPHSRANDMLQSLFAWSWVADGELSDQFIAEKDNWTQTQRNLIEVALWIYEKKLKTESWIPNTELLVRMRQILDGVKFIQLTLSSQQEAIGVFDRINSRGALLDSGDLIKNRIFQSVDSDDDFNQISESWLKMSESLARCSLKRMREPKFLLRAMALSNQDSQVHAVVDEESPDTKVVAPKITYEKLTSYWGERLDPSRQHSHPIAKLNPFDFAKDLVRASGWLHALSMDQDINQKNLHELYFSRYLNSVQHYPMLLAGRNITDFKVLARLTRQVHNRTAFYLLSEERTQDFESLVPTWTAYISKLGAKASMQDIDDIYDNNAKVSESSIDILVEQMKSWNYKSSDKKKIRAVLSQLSKVVDIAAGRPLTNSPYVYFSTKKNENNESYDIDHIQPSKGVGKESPLHLIGNLVLLFADHNRMKKASTPLLKQDVYEDSHMKLTVGLVKIGVREERIKVEKFFQEIGFKGGNWDLSNWNQACIDSRADLYGCLLKHHLTTLS